VYDGLAHIFDGYAPSLDTLYAHPERLEEQYRALSQRLGQRGLPAGGPRQLLRLRLPEHVSRPGQGAAVLRLNTRHYPRSPNAWDSLGEAQAAKGDREQAMQLPSSLALDPKNANAAAQLRKLGQAR
jgi:predicted Zn-dependent protease